MFSCCTPNDASRPYSFAYVAPHLQDLTIDGQVWDNVDDVDKDNAKQAFRDILISVAGERRCLGDATRSEVFVLTLLGGVRLIAQS